ncbi:MAG: hypothetical protein JJU36_11785 [Phycisphaeraceae bacterium]|nr:hypothetical protein [Phycisphaeraceae bacterium]
MSYAINDGTKDRAVSQIFTAWAALFTLGVIGSAGFVLLAGSAFGLAPAALVDMGLARVIPALLWALLLASGVLAFTGAFLIGLVGEARRIGATKRTEAEAEYDDRTPQVELSAS